MTDAVGIDYVDVSMVDCVIRRIVVTDADGNIHEKQLREEVPEEVIMAAAKKRGELNGRVTVSAELSDSIEFGNKGSAFVSMTLACENTIEACQEVHDILQPIVHTLVREDVKVAAAMRDDILAGRNGPPPQTEAPVVGRVSAPPTPSPIPRPRFTR